MLGPAAAAALQANSKRKRELPDSFRKPPVPKRKPPLPDAQPKSHTPVQSRPPSATRVHPATSLASDTDTERLQHHEQVAASTLDVTLQPAGSKVLSTSTPSMASTNLPQLPLPQSASSQSAKAPRRLPGSLAAPTPAPADYKTSAARSAITNMPCKAGPSEHDTKASPLHCCSF